MYESSVTVETLLRRERVMANPPAHSLRLARPSDIDHLVRFGLALGKLHESNDPARFPLQTVHATAGAIDGTYESFFREQLTDEAAGFFLAEVGGSVVGYTYFRLEPASFLELSPPAGWIHDLYVDERTQRAGTGAELVRRTIEELRSRGASEIMLAVAPWNARARRLFARLGFRETMIECMLGSAAETTIRGSSTHRAPGRIRAVVPEETERLVALGVSTGLFSDEEADALLRKTLNDIHAGARGEHHHAFAWEESTTESVKGWVYFAREDVSDGVWNLWWIGVDPSSHGTGIGSELLTFVEERVRAAGARLLIVETASTNELARARAFYRSHHYRDCGVIPDFYGAEVGKVTFAKSFVSSGSNRAAAIPHGSHQ